MLPGWYRVSHATADNAFNLSMTLGGSVETFDELQFAAQLRSYLPCDEPQCSLVLTLQAASIRVHAAVSDLQGASLGSAAHLASLSEADASSTLGAELQGPISVSGGAVAALMPDGLAPVRCPRREACLGGNASAEVSCADGHVGPLCGVCRPGWYLSVSTCDACDSMGGVAPSVFMYAAAAAVGLSLTVLYLSIQYRRFSRSSDKTSARTAGTDRTTSSVRLRAAVRRVVGGPRLRAILAQLARRTRSLGTLGKIILAYFQVSFPATVQRAARS